MILNGYPSRGNDIFGVISKPDVADYETLLYATGPGYYMHVNSNDTNSTFIPLSNFTSDQRAEPTCKLTEEAQGCLLPSTLYFCLAV